MEKTKWGAKIVEIIFTVLITTVVSILITYFFDKDKCSINIGTSVLQNNQYITSVIISNSAKNKAIKSMEISISDFNEIQDGIMNVSYNIDRSNNLLTIDYIPPEETISLFLITKNAINLRSMKIAYDGQINTTYLGDKSNLYILIISQVIIYTIMLIILRYLEYKVEVRRIEKINEIKNEVEEYRKEADSVKKDKEVILNKLDISDKELSNVNTKIYKLRIYYLARMRDYSKELDFWKNTIRKFMYQNSGIDKDNNKIFDIVTNELKTFGTRSKTESNYDELLYLAKNMKEIENEIE